MSHEMKLTEELLKQMPAHIREWVENADGQTREVIESQLGLIGITNFVKHFEYQKDLAEYWDNF